MDDRPTNWHELSLQEKLAFARKQQTRVIPADEGEPLEVLSQGLVGYLTIGGKRLNHEGVRVLRHVLDEWQQHYNWSSTQPAHGPLTPPSWAGLTPPVEMKRHDAE